MKLKKNIRKDVIIFAFIVFCINMLFNFIGNDAVGDELWNFQNLYKIYNGYDMYIDANIIVTPLFFYIGRLFLLIFGSNILAFDIYGSVINTAFLTFLYLIFRNLEMKKSIAIICVSIIYCMGFFTFISRSANYNMLAMVWVAMSIYYAVKNNKYKVKRYNLKQGIICFLILFTKQNIGVYYLIGFTIARIINSNNRKDEFKQLVKTYCVIAVLGILFLVWLMSNKTLSGFFYYVISGNGDFLKNIYFSSEDYNRMDLSILICISVFGYIFGEILLKEKEFSEINKKNIKLLKIISIPMIFISFPIFDYYHSAIALFCATIYALYVMVQYLDKYKIEITKKVKIIFYAFCVLYCFCILISQMKRIIVFNEYVRIKDKNSPFYSANIPVPHYNNMQVMQKYILQRENEGTNVIVIYTGSALYMVPLNKNNGKFDCFNNGNLGKNAGQGVIEEIKQMKNTEILILTDDNKVGWQEPEEVREYIKENLECIGEIEQFSIYKTK